jgi:DNA polymerase III epsilon subunit-like protein
MADSSPPVFYDCEASSLDGFVIEVGWAYAQPDDGQIISASHLVRPLAEWQIATVWDENAEALHGISLAELSTQGIPLRDIANGMNRELAGRELYSDSAFDGAWLSQIFEGAGIEPSFLVRQTSADTLLEKTVTDRKFDRSRYRKAADEAEQNRRHRAEADARMWAQLWQMITKNAP